MRPRQDQEFPILSDDPAPHKALKMTLTIELSPEKEQRLMAKAYQHGLALPDYARQVLEQDAEDVPQPVVLATDKATRHVQIRALVHAPAAVREATLAASAQAVANDYLHDPAVTELTRAFAPSK